MSGFLLLRFKGLVCLEILGKAFNGSSGGNDRYYQTRPAQYLQPRPCEREFLQFRLGNVHLNGEVDGQWPERERPKHPQEVVEERENHGYHRRHNDVYRPPHQAEGVDAIHTT